MYFKYFQLFQYPDHLFFFSVDNLVDLLGRTGFKLVRVYRYPILPQLLAIGLMSRVRATIKKWILKSDTEGKHSLGDEGDGDLSGNSARPLSARTMIKHAIRNAYEYVNYLLRYKIGLITPKEGRPQTVIIVAKKQATTAGGMRPAFSAGRLP